MKLRIITLAFFAAALSACESLPVSAAYITTIGGHKVAATYSKTDGLVVAAEKLPAHPSK
jgi:hypothetical protein